MRTSSRFLALSVAASACGAPHAEMGSGSIVAGHYIWGAEVNVFSPCGSDLEYWVDGTSATIQALRDQYTQLELPPYDPTYVEVRGETGPVLDCGFCEAYDGSFRVEELVKMESPGPKQCVTEMGGAPRENGA